MRILLPLSAVVLFLASCSGIEPPEPYGACPTPQQVEWQRMEMNMFCHFGPNTFTNAEWGNGSEADSVFNPSDLDCMQWAATAKAAGMRGIILTAKHHDGFCLWPNPESDHTVAQCTWRDGKGDVVAELRKACRKTGLKMGLYISPWDRNAPTYGTDEYNNTFARTLEHILDNYGPVFEQWFDGANGEGPKGKRQKYDWPLFDSIVLSLQPNAIIFSDVGPGCRWVGNESGKAGKTCWSTLNTEGFYPGAGSPPTDTLNQGNVNGSRWIPAETDVSIRPGWFWHPNEHPKSLDKLLDIYFSSVGRNSLLLLNVPPDTSGHIAQEDSLRLVELRHAIDSIFATDLAAKAHITASNTRGSNTGKGAYNPNHLIDTLYDSYWATDDNVLTANVSLTFADTVSFNIIMLQEYIPLGQRVAAFSIEYCDFDGNWQSLVSGTTIGYKRLLRIPKVTAQAIRVNIDKAYACPVLNRIALF